MPFKSKAQERWAFATGKKWAKDWADKTNQSKLPKRVGKAQGRRRKSG